MAFNKEELEWAINDVTLPVGGGPNKSEPSSALKTIGYDAEQEPTAEELNWMFYKIYKALEDLDTRSASAGQLPIGSIYINRVDSSNPAIILNYGTWVSLSGRVIVGVGTEEDDRGETRIFEENEFGGQYQEVLTVNQIPPHTHGARSGQDDQFGNYFDATNKTNNGIIQTESTGGGQPHSNMQPYLTAYMWERVA